MPKQVLVIPARGNPRLYRVVKRNVEGFKDARGHFHPIRAGDEYDPGQLSDPTEYQRGRRRAKKRFRP